MNGSAALQAYMAVSSYPEKQSDHAARMARFAMDAIKVRFGREG